MNQPMHIGIKVFVTLLLTVVVFVAFTACKKESNDENNTVDSTQNTSEYTTVNSNDTSDADSPAYGFEEDDGETPKKDNGDVAHTATSKNESGTSASESSNASGNKPADPTPESSNVSENKPGTTNPEDSGKNETESETNQGSLPPKSESQKGEWGASVNN